ncbi:hypothetical protein HPP92_007610 [Vanilla planifolia]|uniref:Scarecrow-like protein 4 n=1 Tax=Vanilla planifolia TaxID=51239 RepID=A0A835V9S3_VANPL|nr:hypothetical protein HPP92_007610 [Vanilla planifolia]
MFCLRRLNRLNAISQIRDLASDRGDPTERVAFYFSEALSQRLSAAGSTALQPDFSEEEETTLCYRAFSDACPYSNFIHLTTNQAILEATESAERILIIDFGITKGVQWAALLQALANRPGGKPSLIRLSGIAATILGVSSARTLAATGNRLLDFARLLDLDFAFEPILEPVPELTSASFRIEPGEAVAVNFTLQLHTMLDDSGDLVDRTLRLVKSLRPSVVTVGEYECRLNRLGFVDRFGEALRYFSALFESLEAAMDRDSDERAQAERLLLGPRILGLVGPGEGSTRTVRMETMEKWKAIMEGSGLKLVPLSHYAESQAKLLLWNYDYSPKYAILESPLGFLTLAWEDFPLFTVSSWL